MVFTGKSVLLLVSLGNLFHIVKPAGQLTWSTDSEKTQLDVLAAEVMHHADTGGSAEGSGQQTSILKELDWLLSDWQTKSSAFGRSRDTPFSIRNSEKTSFKEGQEKAKDHDEEYSQKPVNIIVVTSKTNQNPGPTETCLSGVSPCLIPTNLNGTSLVWDDMKRTLTFAWELHVYGSASIFLLLMLLGVLGMFYVSPLPPPLSEVLILTNSLVVIGVLLRGVVLLLDPYGTRQILSRASFTALHNVSLHLLLWAQTSLALVTLRGLTLMFFQLHVQHWWVVGVLCLAHCIPLVVADIYPSAISHALPLLLQSLSLCWGVPLGFGIVMKSLSKLPRSLRSSLPHWVPSRSVEMCAKRVTAACAVLGIMSSILHMFSLLWMYGLLGNWKRFSWGWWLCQFWGRILEVFWAFSLIVLGFWIKCMLSRGHSKSKGNPGKDVTMLNKVKSHFRKRPLKKSEKTWEELMPNNWSKYKLSRAGINSAIVSYDDHSYKSDYTDPVSTTTCDSQAAVLWQKVVERECVLSLIEFDMVPPSPINLRHSIDNAFTSGSLFIAPPPSWTQSVSDMLPPAYSSFNWAMDTESITASLDHFQTCDSPWFSTDQNNGPTTVPEDELNSELYVHVNKSDDDTINI